MIVINSQVKRVVLKDSTVVHCVWVTRFYYTSIYSQLYPKFQGHGRNWQNHTGSEFRNHLGRRRAHPTTLPNLDLSHQRALCCQVWNAGPAWSGWNLKHLDSTCKYLWQGAFGSVRLAYKLEDRELVVTKFIIVAKVGEVHTHARFSLNFSPGGRGRLGWGGKGRKDAIWSFTSLQFRSPW